MLSVEKAQLKLCHATGTTSKVASSLVTQLGLATASSTPHLLSTRRLPTTFLSYSLSSLMTCVLASPSWHTNGSHFWSSMNPETTPSTHSLEKTPSHGYASSGSESRKPLDSGKKRASRAGTRSVTSLSAAQLERKRANDREAQRAIRQRTKDHIDGLEKNINDLRLAQDADKRALAATQQRNRELEEEVTYLRGRLTDAGFSVPASHAESKSRRPNNHNPRGMNNC